MLTTPNLREATERDAPNIAELLQRIIALHDKVPPPVEQLIGQVEPILRAPDAWYLIAEVGRELVGMVQVNERYSTWDGGHYGYVEDFFVLDDYRGQGIGALMLAHIETRALARAWVRLDLDVLANNEAAHLYERAGYDRTDYVIYRRMLK